MAEVTGRQWKLLWNADPVIKEVSKKANRDLYIAAKIVEKNVKRKLLERGGIDTGEMYNAIKTKKSKYDGWIVGVFGERTTRWEDSLGARAIFFEYGTAGKGYKSRDTAAGRRERQAGKLKKGGQPDRPFFRPGLYASRREIRKRLGLKAGIVRRHR